MPDTALVLYQFKIDSAVAEWIQQKETTGGSRLVLIDDRPRTRTGLEYERTMESFRQFLASGGLDVLPITAQSEEDISRHAIDIARLSCPASIRSCRIPTSSRYQTRLRT